MHTKIVEATNGPLNWGKFMVGWWSKEDWERKSAAPGCESPLGRSLLPAIGWSIENFMVFDLQTGEGALFLHKGQAAQELAAVRARSDLMKHKVWVCPLFEPFLAWLYMQERDRVLALDLPDWVDLVDAPFAAQGYRRPGFTE